MGNLARSWIPESWGVLGTFVRLLIGTTGTLAGLFAGIGLGMLADAGAGAFGASGTLWAPALLGAGLGVVGVYFARGWDQLPSGMAAYYVARTVFNVIRSVEPLIMAIVFVVWVGLGPFAGAIALALHTTASLAKLYSEQVESIMQGADRGGDRHRCDATTEHHLRGRPSNRSAVHRLHALPVGHQRPHVHDHRVRWRWWHRVPPPAEHQSAPLPRCGGTDAGNRHRRRNARLRVRPDPRTDRVRTREFVRRTRNQAEQWEQERLAPAAARSTQSRGRLIPEAPDSHRTAFERDRDRILHTKAFRRLKHKTQVFIDPDGDHFVTRLTHTLQVTQIGRSLAVYLGLNEPLTEAICLGHDVGHSPFGHVGEEALGSYVDGDWHHAAKRSRL